MERITYMHNGGHQLEPMLLISAITYCSSCSCDVLLQLLSFESPFIHRIPHGKTSKKA